MTYKKCFTLPNAFIENAFNSPYNNMRGATYTPNISSFNTNTIRR